MEQPEQCPFLKWAMLESNQRPPPCKGELVISQTFVVVQIFLLTSTFSVLSCRLCSPLFAAVRVGWCPVWCQNRSDAPGIRILSSLVRAHEGPGGIPPSSVWQARRPNRDAGLTRSARDGYSDAGRPTTAPSVPHHR